jgi:hypothetical protein
MEPDFADARWMAAPDYYPTAYLNAVYGTKSEDGRTVKYIYEPTAVLPAVTGSNEQQGVGHWQLPAVRHECYRGGTLWVQRPQGVPSCTADTMLADLRQGDASYPPVCRQQVGLADLGRR